MQSEAVKQWLDEEHVRSLAEGLLIPSPQGRGFPNDKMFGASFVGYASRPEEEGSASVVARQSLSDAQNRAASSGIIRAREPVEPASVPAQPVSEPVQIVPQATRPETPVIAVPDQPEIDRGVEPLEPVEREKSPVVEQLSVEPEAIQTEPLESEEVTVVSTRPQSEPIEEPESKTAEARPEPRPPVIDSPFKIASKPNEPTPPVREVFRPLPLSTRLHAFGIWLKEQIPTRSYFICDRHGEIVVDEVGSEKLVKVARTLAHASSSAGRQVGEDQNLGSLHVKIGPEKVMEVIPRHSHFGLVVLGVIVQRPLSRDAVSSVSRALGTALAEPLPPSE